MMDKIVRKPYRHFGRAQFEKVFIALCIVALLGFTTHWPEHSWNNELKIWAGQFVAVLLVMLRRGTWRDPQNGEGQKPPVDDPPV